MNIRIALPFIALLLISSCDRQAVDRDASLSPAPSATPTVHPVAEAQPAADDQQILIVIGSAATTPNTIQICNNQKNRVGVLRWDLADTATEKVVLTVYDPRQGEEKRFGRGGPSGTKQTGPWLRTGLVFRIRDESSNAELGRVTVESKPCP